MSDGALARLVAAPIAHRGLHACGAPGGPVENSLAAAQAAIAAGYGIECDVQLSRDGVAMVFHDAALARLTGVAGLVAAHDAAALGTMRLGDGDDAIPTLDGFLAAIAGRTPLVIEIKSDGDAVQLTEKVLAAIAGYDGVAALESFDPAVVLQSRASGCRQPIGLVGPSSAGGTTLPPDADAVAASDFLSWDIAHLETAAALGRPLTTWTVRDAAAAARARRLSAQIVFEGFRPTAR